MRIIRKLIRFGQLIFKEPTKEHCPLCYKHEMFGKDLIFISNIKRDGSGTVDVSKEKMSHLDNDEFHVACLSMTQNTYIAHGFNSYVVKLKTA